MAYDLRATLADALPAAGPSQAAVKTMDDIGFGTKCKGNDMKELFTALDISGSAGANGQEDARIAGESTGGVLAAGSSASTALLEYRREKKVIQDAVREEAKRVVKRGGTVSSNDASGKGIGLKHAMGVGGQELKDAASDERYLRKAQQSKSAMRMSSKQKLRRKQGVQHGTEYEERYKGKVFHKAKRKSRLLALKQMY